MAEEIKNTNPEIDERESRFFFNFDNEKLLLPEHAEENPETDYLSFGTSDDDLQF